MGRFGTFAAALVLFAVTFGVVYYFNKPEEQAENPLEGTGIEKLGGKSLIHYVYVPQGELSDEHLFLAAETYCNGTPGCEVRFWTDKAMTPTGEIETTAQTEARFATYRKNRYNGEEVLIRKDREQAIRR
ncbi:hypothetical protein [Rhodospirillum sp. A1_3_36]|uniref:hypothetical protein n=1 Tax=Rhodospirillum sp. A1_3_36 TaxID=3391666 RepID=UPI0039A559FC